MRGSGLIFGSGSFVFFFFKEEIRNEYVRLGKKRS